MAAAKKTAAKLTAKPTVAGYLAALPEERRGALSAVRKVFKENLEAGYAEGILYGMIGYYVPHSLFPKGYHCDPDKPLMFAGLASKAGHMSLHLPGLYMSEAETKWFVSAWAKTKKRLDMGKGCVRFKKLDDLALEVVAEAIRRMPPKAFIELYESGRQKSAASSRKAKTTS